MAWWILLFLAVFSLALNASLLIWQIAGEKRWLPILERLQPAPRSKERSILKDDSVSEIPALNETLRPFAALGALRRVLGQADVKLRPAALILLSLTAALAIGYALRAAFHPGAPLIVALSLASGLAPYAYVLYRRSHRFRRIEAQFPDGLDLMARAMRAGHPLLSAMKLVASEMTGPIAVEFERTFVEQSFGLPVGKAVMNLAERVPLEDVRFFAASVLIQKEAGGNLADVLDNLGRVMRERFKLRRHIRIVSAHGRLSGIILGMLPVAVGLLIYLWNPDYISILFKEPVGRWVLWVSAACQVVGLLLIQKIVRIRV